MTTAESIQSFSAVAAIIVAAVAAWIAHDARNAEKAQAKIANEALAATRRQTELGSVLSLIARSPRVFAPSGTKPQRLNLAIENGGPTVAFGIIVSAALATSEALSPSMRGTERQPPRAWARAGEGIGDVGGAPAAPGDRLGCRRSSTSRLSGHAFARTTFGVTRSRNGGCTALP